MTVRYGANGQPIPEKKKPEALQEILEVNPNVVEEVVEEEIEEVVEEEDENEDL
jgi:predicted Co/Zn/Cd cation transporter (cation efflux family)